LNRFIDERARMPPTRPRLYVVPPPAPPPKAFRLRAVLLGALLLGGCLGLLVSVLQHMDTIALLFENTQADAIRFFERMGERFLYSR